MISQLKKLVSEFPAARPSPNSNTPFSTTVLVVDDEPEMRTIGRIALEQCGYRVLEAANGTEALKTLQDSESEIGLVISDVIMPDMDGFALVRRLKAIKSTLPILLLSGHVVEEDLWGENTACVRFLGKPYHLTDLQNAVIDMIGPVLPVEA